MNASTDARVALVTAGNAGLGRGIAAALASAGYRTAFTYRAGGTGPEPTLDRVRAGGHDAFPVEADFAQRGAGTAAVRAVEAHFGRLDVLVHNVGPIVVRTFARSTADDYEMLLQANLGSAVECAAAALGGMRERGFGRLVFFGMNGSHVTMPARGMALYGAAKAAVVTFARTLALEEAASGITVNIVEPGDIRDKEAGRDAARAIVAANPTGHAGSWEDVAAAVLFLVSDDASFVNGATLQVNGGLVGAYE
jgi:NAD(P)-dependent dehydrogenase (short-subunit alcohol dehydrogenase family)